MAFHQKQFLPFASGAPSIRSLSSSRKQSHVLVTTDRSVTVVQYSAASREYALQELTLESFASVSAEVIASGVIERTGREAIAIAYAEDEKLFLQVVAADELLQVSRSASASSSSGGSGSFRRAASVSVMPSSTRFELVSAPTTIASVQAVSLTSGASEVFHGVLLFCVDSMVAFGFINATTSDPAATTANPSCVRLSSEQFAAFFPEFATFSHLVLAVDTLHVRQARGSNSEDARMQSWVAFGCADGFVRVFQGHVQGGCSCGPYEIKDFQIDGPVTAVSLFVTVNDGEASKQCNLLATCAIGHAVVYEDVFGGGATTTEVLDGSGQFDSIFAGIAADIDLDGHVELLLGTDDQQLLAYKKWSVQPVRQPIVLPIVADKQSTVSTGGDATSSHEEADELTALSASETLTAADEPADPTSDTPPTNQHRDVLAVASQKTELVDRGIAGDAPSTWSQLAKAQWHVEAFGAIYSLAFVDLNRDGVNELLVASSTGVFIYEADALCVLRKLQQVLSPPPILIDP